MLKKIKLDSTWKKYLNKEFSKEYFVKLSTFIESEYKVKTVYPIKSKIFNSLNITPFDKIKVVIIGQDPYHQVGQANGLAFSVNNIKIPPSLNNIFKELESDLGLARPKHGNLESWAKEGVLLINNILTVCDSMPGSHKKQGWELFTDRIIELLNEKKTNLVFILWGSFAHKKAIKVDTSKHCIIKSVHPSPLSSYRGFFGSRPFSKANSYLKDHKIKQINWKIK